MNLKTNDIRKGEKSRKYGKTWDRDELVLALDLYHEPDCLHDSSDPLVRELAGLLGRTSGSVALKLANLKFIDSEKTGGMKNIGSRDVEVWDEFTGRSDALRKEVEIVLDRLNDRRGPTRQTLLDLHRESTKNQEFSVPDSFGERKTRMAQAQFRAKLLDAYENQCALCEIDIKELLIASHIVPWSEDKENRLNPRNGIALCALHDCAFDRGLISFRNDGKVILFHESAPSSPSIAALLKGYGRLRQPLWDPPDPEFLENHRLRFSHMNVKKN